MTLADLGATVVKVERPAGGDETRSWGPPWSASSSTYFDSVNRSKLGVTLDLAAPEDLRAAHELARRADVVVHNLRGLDRFGLDYTSVAATNPRVVYCSITGFGASTPRPGYDFLVQAMGGLMSITGEPDGDPHKVGVALVDVLSGKDATIGILAALAARDRTGRGEHVQIDLLSSLLGSLANQAGSYLATGVVPVRMGNRHPSIAPYETLRCADGLLAVACGNDAQFARLAVELGIGALTVDARFDTNAARVANRDALVAALEGALRGASVADWEQRLGQPTCRWRRWAISPRRSATPRSSAWNRRSRSGLRARCATRCGTPRCPRRCRSLPARRRPSVSTPRRCGRGSPGPPTPRRLPDPDPTRPRSHPAPIPPGPCRPPTDEWCTLRLVVRNCAPPAELRATHGVGWTAWLTRGGTPRRGGRRRRRRRRPSAGARHRIRRRCHGSCRRSPAPARPARTRSRSARPSR